MVSAVSLILVVGVALGVVAFVSTGNNDEPATSGDTTGKVTTHTKAVQAVCQNTDDKKFCSDTFSSVNTSDPTEYVKTVVKKAMDDVIKGFNLSDTLKVENSKGNSTVKMALDDCKDLLEFAIDELQASEILVKENNINNINDRAADLKNWIGAVVAYKESCLDGFDTDGEKEVQSKLKTESLDGIGKLTGLALDVVSGFAEVLSGFNLDLIAKTSSRRLLDVDQEGYPSWLSMPDRKLLADTASVKPNAVVAKDGSGDYKTVEEAINSYPKNHQGRFIIYVKAGTYDEYIKVDKKKNRILLYGDGPTKTIITGNKNVVDGYKTIRTATFYPNQQNIIVADGTDQKNMPTGAVLQNCDIIAEPELEKVKTSFKTYLARPWKAYSRAIFLENTITDVIQPDGYLPWNGNLNLDTCFFAEYENTGAGADLKARVKWSRGVLSKADANKYTADQWLQANAWLPATGIPFTPGLTKP
ncbi:Pectinesterase/pectinesterase inhibitor [Vigna angularis]|uniref:Pectinesterase/pectinesterase inhibitor n=1 Tax=Phaseolus angularis TaxID=3914 RepID=A0A8T0KW25_PHAAN|nr:Pectinesterase/pectinesterase inhibitor [Vigna angularis]